jgi:ABC-type transporter Mla subunit MlaD
MSIENVEQAVAELSPVVDHAVSTVGRLTAKLDEMDAKDARLDALAGQLRNLKDVLASTFGTPEA